MPLPTRAQVRRFSPKSRAILEIQSRRDLEILEKIYANSVPLGDHGLHDWGIRYATEFQMTGDSRLFPPLPQWEAKGYRPDEYSRWLLGDWRPIEVLWADLGIDPSRPQPPEVGLEDWLFDTAADPARRTAEARFVHGHLLKPGDAARTDWRLRCAQPPYDRLPIPRASLPAGVILSREGETWIREDDIRDLALPLYEGRMIGQFDFSQKGWVSGKGRGAVWREIPWHRKHIEPQYLMAIEDYINASEERGMKVAIMSITSSTNARTMIVSPLWGVPCGHSIGVLNCSAERCLPLSAILNSFAYDFAIRVRFSGLNASWFILEETPLPPTDYLELIRMLYHNLGAVNAPSLLYVNSETESRLPRPGQTDQERLRIWIILDILVSLSFGLSFSDMRNILKDCDMPLSDAAGTIRPTLAPKGFWRLDRDKPPELRQTVLTLIAFHDLETKIEAAGGDREQGIDVFLTQNDGEGWLLPETIRLADYDLGHDDRAKHHQPVASRLGPRFYDWQLAQSAAESQRECRLHARNLLGEFRYESLRRGDRHPVLDEHAERRVAERGADYAVDSGSKERHPELFAPDELRKAT